MSSTFCTLKVQLKHTELCITPRFMPKLISPSSYTLILWINTSSVCILLWLRYFFLFSIFFLKIGVHFLCIFYFLYLNYSTSTFLQIGTFQMKSIGKQFLFWEPVLLPSVDSEAFFFIWYLCATKLCALSKGLWACLYCGEIFLIALNTAYRDTIVSISFWRVEVKNDTYLLYNNNKYKLLYFYQMYLPTGGPLRVVRELLCRNLFKPFWLTYT